MGKAGRKRFLKNYMLDKYKRKFVDILERII